MLGHRGLIKTPQPLHPLCPACVPPTIPHLGDLLPDWVPFTPLSQITAAVAWPGTGCQPSAAHAPAPWMWVARTQCCHRPLRCPCTRTHGGGPRVWQVDGPHPAWPGTGSCLAPASTCTTTKRPWIQAGHCRICACATRCMNTCAHSVAAGLSTGMLRAALARPSLGPWQFASSP